MGTDEMTDVANFFARALIKNEDTSKIKSDVKSFKSNYQTVKYCFESGPAYSNLE
jgi:glycine hydroxymethyltransferase